MKKQETLEEFIKEILQDEFFTNIAEYKKAERLIEIGAKWQQERMYSEENMEMCWNASYIDATALDDINYKPLFFEDFIKQFKKNKL
jgi:hypothetical protein